LNTDPTIFKLIDQATILHEALHNITGLEDHEEPARTNPLVPLDLKRFIGIPSTSGSTTDISRALRGMSCAQ
jgi:hypothetical protein